MICFEVRYSWMMNGGFMVLGGFIRSFGILFEWWDV